MDAAGFIFHALVILVAWTVLSLPLALFVGRLIAVGTGDLASGSLASTATPDPTPSRVAA